MASLSDKRGYSDIMREKFGINLQCAFQHIPLMGKEVQCDFKANSGLGKSGLYCYIEICPLYQSWQLLAKLSDKK